MLKTVFSVGSGKVHQVVVRFMQNNSVIKKRDYERYEIIIPFSHYAGKRRKLFLYSELEKMHPCFSDEFTFDSTVKKINKKGICEDVFVVNKYKLAEYESKRSIAGSGFIVESDTKKYRLFIEKKWKLFLWSILLFLISGLIGIAYTFSMSLGSTSEAESQVIVNSGTPSSPGEATVFDREVFDLEFEKDFFSIVSDCKGKILHFDWSYEQKNGVIYKKLNALVKGVYPENLYNLGAHVADKVLYEDGSPKMNVSYEKSYSSKDFSERKKQSGSNSDFNKSLRNILQQYEAILIEENAPPYHIEFVCNSVAELQSNNLIAKLAALIADDNRHISSISINQSGNSQLRFGISIEPEILFGFDMEQISQYIKLFETENRIKKIESKKSEPVIQRESDQEKKYHKIGEIKKSGGEVYVFYKNEEGKIKNVVNQKEVEK